jgi:hypothetical protein
MNETNNQTYLKKYGDNDLIGVANDIYSHVSNDTNSSRKRSKADVKNDISGDIHLVQIHSLQMKLPTNKLGKVSSSEL